MMMGYTPWRPLPPRLSDHEVQRLIEEYGRIFQENNELKAQIARMQAERWTPTITGEPGCDDEVSWSHSQVHNP